jgi:hypothetical protein
MNMGQQIDENQVISRRSDQDDSCAEPTRLEPEVAARIRLQAFQRLSVRERATTNLYLDQRVHRRGVQLGPESQQLFAPCDCVLVFADDHPLENFAHACRYLLFDASTGQFYEELRASFPPYGYRIPPGYVAFSTPILNQVRPEAFGISQPAVVPAAVPDGRRYAILFSGSNELRHMNSLEFCYRTLVDRFSFDTDDIFVLLADGTLHDLYGNVPLWSGGDGTSAFRMQVTDTGDRPGFQRVMEKLAHKHKLGSEDLLFIYTSGHGSTSGSESVLCAYVGNYTASDFSSDLGTLPKHRALIVMMSQCDAGGFNDPVVAASSAKRTTIASAVPLGVQSHASSDGFWDAFGRNWIAAQLGFGTDGLTKVDADTDDDGAIEAEEAFSYAEVVNATYATDLQDDPVQNDSSWEASDLTLGLRSSAPLTWDALIATAMKKYHVLSSSHETMKVFREHALPRLQRLVLPALERNAVALRAELEPGIDAIIAEALAAHLPTHPPEGDDHPPRHGRNRRDRTHAHR